MKRVRFAPSPTGSLHVGNALSAVANRAFGDWMLLRIDDTDPERNLPGGEDAILADLAWLGVEWDEGPVRQSERSARYTEAGSELGDRFGRKFVIWGSILGVLPFTLALPYANLFWTGVLTVPIGFAQTPWLLCLAILPAGALCAPTISATA